MYVPDDLSRTLLAAFGIITSDENFREQIKKTVRKLWDMIKVSTPIPKILGTPYGFPKKCEKSRTSLGKKFRKL